MQTSSNLSVLHLIAQASLFVQIIMLVLFCMLLCALYMTGKKWVQFWRLRRKIERFEAFFWSSNPLQDLYERHKGKDAAESIERIFRDGFSEFLRFNGMMDNSDAILNNCRRAMEAALNRVVNEQEKGLSLLATIGSSAPYIGLLGTVFGIMNSFIAIGGAAGEATSISSVAPGIAEALSATAIGLLAAIAAVLSYNYFVARSEALSVQYEAFIEDFSNYLQRQIITTQYYQSQQNSQPYRR